MSTKKIKARKMWLNLASDGVIAETLKWDKRSRRVYVIDASDIPKLRHQIANSIAALNGWVVGIENPDPSSESALYWQYADGVLASLGIKEKGKR